MRKAFTLVELLIVIVVIGVLAAMMMLSSSEAVSSAKATKILADFDALKKASISWYVNNLDKIDPDGRVRIGKNVGPIQEWNKYHLGLYAYLSNGANINLNGVSSTDFAVNKYKPLEEGGYGIYDAGNGHRDTWFVGYKFAAGEDSVRSKLMAKAGSAGLHFTNDYPEKGKGTKIVWMHILGDWHPKK